MNYELVNMKLSGSFDTDTNQQRIEVITGIVGDTYEFTRSNILYVSLDPTKSIDENKSALNQAAIDYVTKNYPNT